MNVGDKRIVQRSVFDLSECLRFIDWSVTFTHSRTPYTKPNIKSKLFINSHVFRITKSLIISLLSFIGRRILCSARVLSHVSIEIMNFQQTGFLERSAQDIITSLKRLSLDSGRCLLSMLLFLYFGDEFNQQDFLSNSKITLIK